ncbi:hypothetical protein C8P70_1316 [Myroides indicus]|uniref:Uncharacterized protein n=1 Tax=Myroides indicus TaxID=1323422 RepID=A0A4R7EN24_9FLAO|nr:hypothetical protein C8P70_1316 [Myroides indicus]
MLFHETETVFYLVENNVTCKPKRNYEKNITIYFSNYYNFL